MRSVDPDGMIFSIHVLFAVAGVALLYADQFAVKIAGSIIVLASLLGALYELRFPFADFMKGAKEGTPILLMGAAAALVTGVAVMVKVISKRRAMRASQANPRPRQDS